MILKKYIKMVREWLGLLPKQPGVKNCLGHEYSPNYRITYHVMGPRDPLNPDTAKTASHGAPHYLSL
jgi:hypothetical protein